MARFGKFPKVEVFTVKKDEGPRTDAGKWIQEDIVFGCGRHNDAVGRRGVLRKKNSARTGRALTGS